MERNLIAAEACNTRPSKFSLRILANSVPSPDGQGMGGNQTLNGATFLQSTTVCDGVGRINSDGSSGGYKRFSERKRKQSSNVSDQCYGKASICLEKASSMKVVLYHQDLFGNISHFLGWVDLLSLTHSCSKIFKLGATFPFIWREHILSQHLFLTREEQRLERELKRKSELSSSIQCYFDTFRDVYQSLNVPAENKCVKCFESLFEILFIEGSLQRKRKCSSSEKSWRSILTFLVNPNQQTFEKTSWVNKLEDTSHLDITPNIGWSQLIEYFYSPQSFFDASIVTFSEIKKIYEYFQMTFKPYPEMIVLFPHYLNYNENANADSFTSPTRAFVGWSFFFGKFLECNIDLVTERREVLEQREDLELKRLPFVIKKFRRDLF